MSQKQFDFDHAIESLKAKKPSHVPSVSGLLAPRRPVLRRGVFRFAMVAAVAFVAVGLLWPRSTSIVAFAQVRDNLESQRRVHIVTEYKYLKGGQTEAWVDGDKFYHKLQFHANYPTFVAVSDGEYITRYMGGSKPQNGTVATAWKAKLSTKKAERFYIGPYGQGPNIVDEFLKSKSLELVGQKLIESPDGPVMRYSVRWSNREPMNVYADPKTKLISKIETLSNKGAVATETRIEYPTEIPASTFQFSIPGVQVRSIDDTQALIKSNVETGLGSQTVAGKTITLRAVLHDTNGGLWVLWTGGAPRGDLQHPVKIQGFPVPRTTKATFPGKLPEINAFGHKAFTVGAEAAKVGKPSPAIGQRLGGMGIGMRGRSLDKVTLTIPVLNSTGGKKLGEVTFKDVPVVKIQMIYDYSEILGIR